MKLNVEKMSNDQLAELLINYGTTEVVITKSTKTMEVFFHEDYIKYEEDDLVHAYNDAAVVAMYIYNSQEIKSLRDQQQLDINNFIFYNRTENVSKHFEFYKVRYEEIKYHEVNEKHWDIGGCLIDIRD